MTRIADLEALCADYKRSYDRVCREHKALTEQVIAALSTPEHHHEMRGGMPFCSCWYSLRGDEGRALDVLIEHLLDVARKEAGRLHLVERHAREVMDYLDKYGPTIVPHLLDDDDNSGEFLRRALNGAPDGT